MNSREDLANLAVKLKSFSLTKDGLMKDNELVPQMEGLAYLANLVATGQDAMIQLAEFTKNFQSQGLRMQEIMARLEQSVALLKAIHKGQITNVNEEIESFLNLKSNIVNFALEGPIAPQENKE